MKFSIIIPTYNHLDVFKPCLESVIRDTTLDDAEIIVVANGCTDGTKDYLATLKELPIVPIFFKNAIGYPKAVNAGLRIAKGDYIILLNNDTELIDWGGKDTWINHLLLPFSVVPNCGITGSLKSYSHTANTVVWFGGQPLNQISHTDSTVTDTLFKYPTMPSGTYRVFMVDPGWSPSISDTLLNASRLLNPSIVITTP